MLFCGWLFNKDYRGALLIEEKLMGVMEIAYDKAAPVAKYNRLLK
jgi:hypothetical protein